jgi:hypothetical protein
MLEINLTVLFDPPNLLYIIDLPLLHIFKPRFICTSFWILKKKKENTEFTLALNLLLLLMVDPIFVFGKMHAQ